jgi:hypothetical protein
LLDCFMTKLETRWLEMKKKKKKEGTQ